jgi:hypothetical protein
MAAPLNQQQQLKNEATKMAMRVPLFYGNKKEDTMNIKDFITRFESACTAMGLANDAEKCNLFGSHLIGRATAMWMNATYQGVDVDSWRSVKKHFMIRYRGKVEITTFCHQIPKLVQDKTETVSDFETSPPSSVASARRKDTCGKSDTPGSTRTPPVLTGTAGHCPAWANWPQWKTTKTQN